MIARNTLCGILILAAGNSSRLGQPKQLLQHNNKSLIRHVLDEALEVSQTVVVVTGAFNDQILQELEGIPVFTIHNPDWHKGMGSSLAAGLKYLTAQFTQLKGVIVCVSDQPYISREILRGLYQETLITEKGIVACSYGNALGTPVFFSDKYFDELLNVNAQTGAKALLSRHKNDLGSILFPLGYIDIDTQEDYDNIRCS